jgi:hypothetical protein
MAKAGVYGWKIAAGTEVFFWGQCGGFILLSITRSQSQQSAHKDLEPKWPKPVFMDGKLQQGQKYSFLGNSVALFCFL